MCTSYCTNECQLPLHNARKRHVKYEYTRTRIIETTNEHVTALNRECCSHKCMTSEASDRIEDTELQTRADSLEQRESARATVNARAESGGGGAHPLSSAVLSRRRCTSAETASRRRASNVCTACCTSSGTSEANRSRKLVEIHVLAPACNTQQCVLVRVYIHW